MPSQIVIGLGRDGECSSCEDLTAGGLEGARLSAGLEGFSGPAPIGSSGTFVPGIASAHERASCALQLPPSTVLPPIAQVTAFPHEHIGGSEFYAHQLAVRLANRGHRVSVITSNLGSWTSRDEVWGNVPVERCAAPGMLWSVNPTTWALPALLRSDASILHVHTHYFLASIQAALVAKPLRKKLLLHLHGLDVTGMVDSPKMRNLTRFREELYDRIVTKWIVKRADAIASVSRRDLEILRELYKVPEERLHWIPNAVDLSEFSSLQRVDGDRPTLTFIGRLEPTKGADLLPAIIDRLARESMDFRVDIVGDGALRPQLESALQRYDGNIQFYGSVRHERIPEVLARSRALIIPSRVEGVPTVALEALAAGVPVVAADVGGTREVVRNGATGFLCRPGDVSAFAECVRFLLDNEEVAERLGGAGPSVVAKDYCWSSVLTRVESLYAKLVN